MCSERHKFKWESYVCVFIILHECTSWVIYPPKLAFHKTVATRSKTQLYESIPKKRNLNLLLIDHYDSFTYNLVDLLAQYTIHRPTVIAADSAKSWDELMRNQQKKWKGHSFDGIILSPGPGHPEDPMSSLSRDCVREKHDLPILGVCLGHQIVGTVYGAKVDLAPEPVHGQIRHIRFVNDNVGLTDPLWKNINSTDDGHIKVTRYHSLHVSQLNGTNLIATALADDSNPVLMSMRHVEFPHFGVQFHPESIGTNDTGKRLLQNFVEICWRHKQDIAKKAANLTVHSTIQVEDRPKSRQHPAVNSVYVHKVPNLLPNRANMRPIDVMSDILGDDNYTFWLDEARAVDETNPGVSILGSCKRRVEYWGKDKDTERQGLLVWNDNNSLMYKNQSMDIVTYLYDQHQRITESVTFVNFTDTVLLERLSDNAGTNSLPFHFRGGHVGYFGYEVRHDTRRYNGKGEHSGRNVFTSTTESSATIPTAAFLWADKSFIYDHHTHEWYLVCVHTKLDDNHAFEKTVLCDWMQSMSRRLMVGLNEMNLMTARKCIVNSCFKSLCFTPTRSQDCYNRNFEQCLEHIRQGESYELCLTNRLECEVPVTSATSPFNLYKILRQQNPAPFSAFFHWNPSQYCESNSSTSAVAICCTSPERFVSVKQKQSSLKGKINPYQTLPKWEVEAKPIKGTIRRIVPSNGKKKLTLNEQIQDRELARTLQTSVKDRAENLMIVDLLRNDLSQVCETGSVHVSKLMDIESFATVHQMVSTIRGTLLDDKSAMDVFKACFPGGSMTGAPKVRTMELLDEIENHVCRGPYSGCLGYISVNGCMDMNIIIRTAILTPVRSSSTSLHKNSSQTNNFWKVSIGAGGAITALSKPTDEYNEMMLKASPIISAVQDWSSVLCDDCEVSIAYQEGQSDLYVKGNNTSPLPTIES
jgi:para-aminobenzoate synthetase